MQLVKIFIFDAENCGKYLFWITKIVRTLILDNENYENTFLDDATFENTLLDDENCGKYLFWMVQLMKLLILDGTTCKSTYFG